MSRTADVLVEAIMLDCMPRPSACVDFGLDNGNIQQRFEAYYYPVRAGEITADQLQQCLIAENTGKALTELVRNAHHNPHKSIEITTVCDLL